MKVRHRRFIEEFCISGNKADAARLAGYSEDRAKQQGHYLYNLPEIRAETNRRLTELTMSAEEAAKHDSDIARTRLNDFFVIKKVQAREQSEQYVTVLLEACEEEIEMIREFIEQHELSEEEQAPFKAKIKSIQAQALDYQIDILKYGKTVTRLALGRPVVMEIAELDLVALSKAKDIGRIAEFSQNEQGTKVKMYAADKAIERVLKMNGKLIERRDITSGGKSFADFLMEPDATVDE